ncbi:MAG TPA: esterase-like activity of phytase family protein [Ramlibacter sp.]|nr:esterase-like activity of phytase family protein [Ramlibacter sp.]
MFFRANLLAAAAAAAIAAFTAPAHAVDLVAIGAMSSELRDHSGQSALLESGLPGDLLGGMGSGLAWAGGNTFLALPDRGPNATEWNASVDSTTSYIPRFHTITLDLLRAPDTARNLPMMLAATLTNTTLLSSHSPLVYGAPIAGYTAVPALNTPSRKYFTGRSDNFDAVTSSASARDARFDPEGIRVSANGRFVYISDEYGPYLYQFHRDSGERVRAIALPAKLAVAHKSAQSGVEISGNTQGRVANKGMEGLAISPNGKMLFGFVQSPLIEDGGDGGRMNRIVAVNLETEQVTEYAYDNYLADKSKTYNTSELLALNDHELLVLERDGKGLGDNSAAVVKRIYKVDIAGAADVSALSGSASLQAKALPKTLFLDITAKLTQAGVTNDLIPAKLEGMAFGEDIVVDGVTKHTLYITNDNDYLSIAPGGKPNPNQFFVFTFTEQDLGGSQFVNQSFTAGAR